MTEITTENEKTETIRERLEFFLKENRLSQVEKILYIACLEHLGMGEELPESFLEEQYRINRSEPTITISVILEKLNQNVLEVEDLSYLIQQMKSEIEGARLFGLSKKSFALVSNTATLLRMKVWHEALYLLFHDIALNAYVQSLEKNLEKLEEMGVQNIHFELKERYQATSWGLFDLDTAETVQKAWEDKQRNEFSDDLIDDTIRQAFNFVQAVVKCEALLTNVQKAIYPNLDVIMKMQESSMLLGALLIPFEALAYMKKERTTEEGMTFNLRELPAVCSELEKLLDLDKATHDGLRRAMLVNTGIATDEDFVFLKELHAKYELSLYN